MVDRYAPPQHEPAPPAPAGTVPWNVARPLPSVCLKCGSDEATTLRHVRLAIGPKSTSLGALGGVFGAMIAQQLRGNGILLVPILVFAAVAIGALAFFARRRTVYVELDLPLCERHDTEWDDGETLGRRLALGMVVAALAVGAGALFDTAFLLGTGIAGFVGALVAALVLRPARRYVAAASLVGEVVHLTGVGPEAAAALAKAGRKKAQRSRAKSEPDAL